MSLARIMWRFENWYKKENRSSPKNPYLKVIRKDILTNLPYSKFIDFFYKFSERGGYIQSNGPRNKDRFLEQTLKPQTSKFRTHILRPFENDFNLQNWWEERNQFLFWGPGIASIYLTYVDRNRFSIINNKTITAMRMLGQLDEEIVNDNDFTTYRKFHYIQQSLMDRYPNINNFIKADGLLEYITTYLKHGITSWWSKKDAEKLIKSASIKEMADIITDIPEETLLAKIQELGTGEKGLVEYNGQRYHRNHLVTEMIKKLRGYKCQFCGATILKKDGSHYIEACHITPKCKAGKETLENILVLCPNCHKEFDYGKREKEQRGTGTYQVSVNGKGPYIINFEK